MAEEQSLLQLNADDKAEGSEDRKASQQIDFFHGCLYYFKS